MALQKESLLKKPELWAGDVIVQIGSYQIKDMQGYMDALGKFEKGQVVPVKLKREKEILTLSVTF